MSVLRDFILGGRGIASTGRVLAGLTRDVATRPVPGLPYTIHGLLWHLEFCQALLLRQVVGEAVDWPPAAQQWPTGDPDEAGFEALLARLRGGLSRAAALAADPDRLAPDTREALEDLCAHNAYHWGQVVTLRRLLNDWPDA